MKKEDKKLQELFNRVFAHMLTYSTKFPVQMIASTYVAVGIRLYKTVLSEKEFEEMMQTLSESNPDPYDLPKGKLH
tara:strand:- start:240 stop:467 length:228 start_codon:yes stop_codon:yes gene_type:complete